MPLKPVTTGVSVISSAVISAVVSEPSESIERLDAPSYDMYIFGSFPAQCFSGFVSGISVTPEM